MHSCMGSLGRPQRGATFQEMHSAHTPSSHQSTIHSNNIATMLQNILAQYLRSLDEGHLSKGFSDINCEKISRIKIVFFLLTCSSDRKTDALYATV